MDGQDADSGEPYFRVRVREIRGTVVAGVFGEIDLATVGELRDGLREAVETAGRPGHVVVDLRGTEFIEVIGLKALFEESERLRLRGGELCMVISGAGQVSRALEMTGLDEAFVLYEDLALVTGSG